MENNNQHKLFVLVKRFGIYCLCVCILQQQRCILRPRTIRHQIFLSLIFGIKNNREENFRSCEHFSGFIFAHPKISAVFFGYLLNKRNFIEGTNLICFLHMSTANIYFTDIHKNHIYQNDDPVNSLRESVECLLSLAFLLLLLLFCVDIRYLVFVFCVCD